ncbi:MAG: hypothetical protein H6738_15035 [Alphaproteobacteria bacterium]|nr:hypothetical protein [Alphaproteobacteria bacterium]
MTGLLLLRSELRGWLRRPGVHLFFGLFFLLGLATMGSIAGSIEFIQVGGFGGQQKADSPTAFVLFGVIWGLFATMNIAAASAGAATRDVTDRMHPLVHSTPVSRWNLLVPRYLGGLLVSAYLVSGPPLGMLVARALPILEPERIGALNVPGTLLSLLVWLGPNVLFTSALFFAIGSLTRRMFPAYIGGVFLFVGYLGASAFSDLDDRTIGVLIDPFGSTALDELTRYWTPAESNTLLPIPTGMGLANRALWTGVGLATLLFAFVATPLDEHGWQPLARLWRRPKEVEREVSVPVSAPVPRVARRFDLGARLLQLRVLTRRAVGDVIGHRYFWAFVAAALLFELLNAQNIGKMYGTETWPVTYKVIEMLEGTLGLFLVVVTAFYAGELVWQDRDRGSDQLVDSTPIPDAFPLLARVVALTAVVLGLHTTVLLVGPLFQLFKGYTTFEPALYVRWIYVHSLLRWIPTVVLAIGMHALANHKVVGHGAVIGFFVAMVFRESWGFELDLPWYDSSPSLRYSDMAGWGNGIGAFWVYRAYWLAACVALLAATRLVWVRGTSLGFRHRLAEARRRLDGPTLAVGGVASAVFVGFAAFLGWETVAVGQYENSSDTRSEQAAYERGFKATWAHAPHPEVTAVDARVDLYPSEARALVHGTLSLVNPHDVPIERMLVHFADEDDVVSWTMDPPATEERDPELEVRVWTLSRPIPPGGTATLTFEVDDHVQGMPNGGPETSIVGNGTFLHHGEVFPSFGYQEDWELSDPADRRKHDLPERPRMRDLDDPEARAHSYLGDDAHRVPFQVRLSTEPGQTPLAPGSVVDEGMDEGGRPWRTYRADRPILYFFAFLSGKWEIARRDDGPVPVEVWYHPTHASNVDRMLEGMVASLRTFEERFGPYQHEILRIVEFPRYDSYAQSFPTLIPFSESIGFVARVSDPDEDIDYVYYVTAHEVAHQWWAHQVIAGNGQGATLLSESLAQYSSLRVMEEAYGSEHIDRFLTYESDRYFSMRSGERDEELPLMRMYADQQYIHYQKGGVVLYALSERVGRDRFEVAVRTFLDQWRFAGPPYPTARDFVDTLRAELPDADDAITDAFERIVLYDLRAGEPSVREEGGRFLLTLDPVTKRMVAAGDGAETEEPFHDEVEVRIEGEGDDVHEVRAVTLGDGPVEIALDWRPVSVKLDPRGLFLDRDRDDDEADVVPR